MEALLGSLPLAEEVKNEQEAETLDLEIEKDNEPFISIFLLLRPYMDEFLNLPEHLFLRLIDEEKLSTKEALHYVGILYNSFLGTALGD